jgi:GT2 family glycosyltransferase
VTRAIEICIPVWNERKRIEHVLSALSAQTFKDFAVRIFDNASDDDTVALARGFAAELDLSVVERTRNIGQNNNINRAFANCTSPYVALLSGNDIAAQNYLEALFARLESDPDAVCAFARQVQLVEGADSAERQFSWLASILDDDPVNRACKSIATYGANSQFFALYRRSVLERVQPQPFRFGGDNVMACEVALYGKVLYADDTSLTCSASPGDSSAVQRVRHLLRLFSMDAQRGLPEHSRLGRFEHLAPMIDMFHAHLEMFRLADIAHDARERLVVDGLRALLKRHGQRIAGDVHRVLTSLRTLSEMTGTRDFLDRVWLLHALQKADECLLLVDSPELTEIRDRISRLYHEAKKPVQVTAA